MGTAGSGSTSAMSSAAGDGAGPSGAGLGGSANIGLNMQSGGAHAAAPGGFAGQALGGRAGTAGAGVAGSSVAIGLGAGGNASGAFAGAGGGAGVQSAGGTSSAGSSAGGSDTTTEPATWDTIKLVLTGTHPPCNSSICHGGNGKVSLGFPVGNDDQLYSVLTQFVSKACDNMVLVVPGHPEQSALVKVIKGPCSTDVPRMPNGCTEADGNCVPDDYIAAVEQWIADGANRP